MLDFFVIISRGGIVLWYIKSTTECVKMAINAFLKTLILKVFRYSIDYSVGKPWKWCFRT